MNGLILARDLNATLMAYESWGLHCRIDPLADRIYNLFVSYHLVEIFPCPLTPTWNNRGVGKDHVGKWLDRFLVHEDLIERLGYEMAPIYRTYIYDHTPITLRWRIENVRRGVPFKFTKHGYSI